ncbi:MAG TPA: vitamin K epoxide reductase family protein [Candidatus Saccharimonadales bacterium]|nr:vitamin K epoxide reductase family protein [Candidatus Saccharimonadales bacterium]
MSPRNWTLKKTLPYILIIGGIIGVVCAFALSQDRVKLASNPGAQLECSLNPVVSCVDTIKSSQGEAFGFPNPFLGLAGYAAILTIGAAMTAGARFKRWFWLAVECGLLFAFVFLAWLFFQSLYTLHVLCPYCLGVDAVTIPMFWYVTLYNIDQKHIRLPKRAKRAYKWVRRHHLDLLALSYLLIIFWILKHFWYYYGRNF